MHADVVYVYGFKGQSLAPFYVALELFPLSCEKWVFLSFADYPEGP